jgi:hypothetical protein
MCVAASSPPIPTPSLAALLETQATGLSSTWFFFCFKDPLSYMLPFHPYVDAALGSDHPIVLVDPCPVDKETLARELRADARQPTLYATAYRMEFGCVNYNGHQDDPSKIPSQIAEDDGTWLPTPSEETLLAHIEEDWIVAQQCDKSKQSQPRGRRLQVPASMQDRFYCKDVSESDGWAEKEEQQQQSNSKKKDEEIKSESEESFFPELEKRMKEIRSALKSSITDEKWKWRKALRREFYDHRTNQRAFQRTLEAESKLKQQRYLIHPLYLNELQLHRRSLVSLSFVAFEGVKDYYLYLKIGFQFFNLHIEQMIFTFVHHQLEGESVWFLIPFNQLDKLYELAAEMYRVVYRMTAESLKLSEDEFQRHCLIMGRALLYSKQLWPPLSLLQKHGIEYSRIVLRAGQVLTAAGDCAHFGFSTHPGQTVSVASNMATERWLKRGLPFLIDFFTWLGELDKIVAQQQAAWVPPPLPPPPPSRTVAHQLKSPLELAAKSTYLCPINFACSFVRGLYADMDAMLHGTEPVCEYPLLAALAEEQRRQRLDQHQRQCATIVQLIHKRRPDILKMLKAEKNKPCKGCEKNKAYADHTCLLCLCRGSDDPPAVDPQADEMLPDAESTTTTTTATKTNNKTRALPRDRARTSSRSASRSSAASVTSETY